MRTGKRICGAGSNARWKPIKPAPRPARPISKRPASVPRPNWRRAISSCARQLTQNQDAAGVAAKENVVLAQTQWKSTQAQAIDIGVQRAQLEHAIALL